MLDVEIVYSIRINDEEVGFGSSGCWSDIDSAAYAVHTVLQRREWETTGDMPGPAVAGVRDV